MVITKQINWNFVYNANIIMYELPVNMVAKRLNWTKVKYYTAKMHRQFLQCTNNAETIF